MEVTVPEEQQGRKMKQLELRGQGLVTLDVDQEAGQLRVILAVGGQQLLPVLAGRTGALAV